MDAVAVEAASVDTCAVETCVVDSCAVDTCVVDTCVVDAAAVNAAAVETVTVETVTVDSAAVDTADVDAANSGKPAGSAAARARADEVATGSFAENIAAAAVEIPGAGPVGKIGAAAASAEQHASTAVSIRAVHRTSFFINIIVSSDQIMLANTKAGKEGPDSDDEKYF